ncbi:MAG: hypothetical protein COA42_18520 [Alteromonadaceae bacterium]|nr:MAG: hypothetical protein COA42_18520 [Alteromonadaceae bacterium]
MKFLCEKHRQIVINDEANAISLWCSAYRNGQKEYERKNWSLARLFFGSAYEIALLCLQERSGRDSGLFSPAHMSEPGSQLVNIFCHLDDFDRAEQYLIEMYEQLLNLHVDTGQGAEPRKQAFNLVESIRQRLADFLGMRGKVEYANALNVLCATKGQGSTAALMH